MLHKDPFIIAPKTLKLVQELQSLPELSEFHLVGGTALALQLGHRNSVDIDLFTLEDFAETTVTELISKKYKLKEIYKRRGTIICLVNNIKTDFIRYNHPLLTPPVEEEGVRMLGKEDISAMKFHAIIQSGKRLKDFIDVYFLLEHFSMQKMVDFFSAKYTYTNPMIAMKAINYFDDIDEAMDPPKLLQPLPLEKIKTRIREATLKPGKIFKQE